VLLFSERPGEEPDIRPGRVPKFFPRTRDQVLRRCGEVVFTRTDRDVGHAPLEYPDISLPLIDAELNATRGRPELDLNRTASLYAVRALTFQVLELDGDARAAAMEGLQLVPDENNPVHVELLSAYSENVYDHAGITTALKAVETARSRLTADSVAESCLRITLGTLQYRQDRADLAVVNLMHAYQTGVTHQRLVQRMIAGSALSKVMRDMGDYTQALALNAEVIEWNTAQNASLNLSVSRFLRGSILKEQRNFPAAISEFKRARDLSVDLDDTQGIAFSDLLSTADPETARDLANTLMLNQGFEELTKKSLLARFIKIFPGIQSLVAADAESKEEQVLVSRESFERKRTEYETIVSKKIPENSKAIATAREHGDLKENSEYKMAKQDQQVLMAQKTGLERDLGRARITDFKEATTDQISVGSVVEVKSGGGTTRYTILGAWDSDPDKNVVSYKTPLGAALLGKKTGDTVKVKTGASDENYTIVTIGRYADKA